MPEITNNTLKSEFAKVAKVLNERGENLSAEHVASVVVRTVLLEFGLTEELGEEYKTERVEVVKAIKNCFTAPKNYQNSYLANTEVDGKKIMPVVKGEKKDVDLEFA